MMETSGIIAFTYIDNVITFALRYYLLMIMLFSDFSFGMQNFNISTARSKQERFAGEQFRSFRINELMFSPF